MIPPPTARFPHALTRTNRHHMSNPEAIQTRMPTHATSTSTAQRTSRKVGCRNPPRKCIRNTTWSHRNYGPHSHLADSFEDCLLAGGSSGI
jgi:hypothetical protein